MSKQRISVFSLETDLKHLAESLSRVPDPIKRYCITQMVDAAVGALDEVPPHHVLKALLVFAQQRGRKAQ
jgi:hypothetical protein